MSARNNDSVARVAADATRLSQSFEQSDVAIRLVNHGVSDGPDDGDGPALVLSDQDADFRMSYQAIGFENFGDLLLRLDFRKASNAKTNRDKRNTNRARLANPYLARQFRHIKDGDVQKVAVPNKVFVRNRLRSCGKTANPIIDLLGSFDSRRALCKNTGSENERAA